MANGPCRVAVLWASIVGIAAPGLSQADTAKEQQADRLFKEAKALTDQGNYAPACPKLEESQRLDPAIGTQFNLADCYEHTAHPAAAYRLFLDVAALSHAAGKAARERDARERAAALELKVARLTLRAASNADFREMDVHRDGQAVTVSDLGTAVPLDPGDHVVEATAPGKTPWRTHTTLVAGISSELVIPPLADQPLSPAAMPPPPPAPESQQAPGLSKQRIGALIAGGAGIVGLAVGSIFGVLSISANSSAKSVCPQPNPCSNQTAANKWIDATSDGNVSTIGFVAGGVLLGGAAAIWFTAPSHKRSAGTNHIDGVALDRPGGVALDWAIVPRPGGGLLSARGTF